MADFPIQDHPTWKFQDSTKLETLMDCARKHFFRYELGWEVDKPNIHLVFGIAWHEAMRHMLLTHNKDVQGALSEFMKVYRKEFLPETDIECAPKNPIWAALGLVEYAKHYSGEEFEVIELEVAGTVPISEVDALHFKLDSVVKTEKGIKSREHKTSGRHENNWREKWNLKTQIGTYLHALNCLYDIAEVEGVEVNGAFFLKTKGKEVSFEQVLITKNHNMMNDWLYTVTFWVEYLKTCFEDLKECLITDNIMECFPKNLGSCDKYGGCPYMPFCGSWANPLQKAGPPPAGFKLSWWDPREREAKIQKVVNIGRTS